MIPMLGFIPPAPPPRYVAPNAKPSLAGYLRYFQIMSRNPLEVFTESHFATFDHHAHIFGRPYAILHDPESIRHYLVSNAENYQLTELRKAMFEPVIGNGLLIAEGELWKRTRKALTPVFTPRHVAGFGPTMVEVCERHRAGLMANAGDTISMSKQMLQLALDVLIACLFSDDANLDGEKFSDDLDLLLQLAGMPHPLDLMGAPKWAPRVGRAKARRVVADLRQQVWSVLRSRRKLMDGEGVHHRDFLSLLLAAGVDEGIPLSDDEIIDNLLTFLAAGHETTARTLTWAFYLLSQSPDVTARVIDEVAGAGLDAIEPHKWAPQLPYLTAVIKETMRLYPAASMFTRGAINEDVIGGQKIVPGTEVMTSPWVLHRHRKLWDAPDMFDPERFFGDAEAKIDRFAYVPFGKGPRVCIGAAFSLQEMIIALAILVPEISFAHIGGAAPQPVMRITIQPSTPVEMRIEKRNGAVH